MADAPKVGSSVLVGVMAFIAASALVANEVLSNPAYMPSHVVEPRLPPKPAPAAQPVVMASEPEPEPVVEPAPPVAKPAMQRKTPAAKRSPPRRQVAARSPVARTKITVQAQRPTLDARIRQEVLARLASHPRIDGKIAVESRNAVVRLTGWTRTPGQARSAESAARSVRSVKQVRNEIRPRVGGGA